VSIPAEAMQQTPEGAVAFVKFYFDQVNKAYMTPDAALIPPLGETECKSCEALQANAVEYVNLRHRYTTKSAELLNVAAVEGGAEGQQMVSFSLHQIQADLVDANGQVVTTTTDETYERKALLTWKEGRWSMLGIA